MLNKSLDLKSIRHSSITIQNNKQKALTPIIFYIETNIIYISVIAILVNRFICLIDDVKKQVVLEIKRIIDK
ncbi:hypothetical protein [Wolbachia endosymbiont of Pentidionis agamae]|uniref:hypothetical protein n=1 Tax=Wolbachia endosymbiont of Pentidionis agamae TaxID=3110435 RepID=UPI002FD41085